MKYLVDTKQKGEYIAGSEEEINYLNSKGADGWQLCFIITSTGLTGNVYYFFK